MLITPISIELRAKRAANSFYNFISLCGHPDRLSAFARHDGIARLLGYKSFSDLKFKLKADEASVQWPSNKALIDGLLREWKIDPGKAAQYRQKWWDIYSHQKPLTKDIRLDDVALEANDKPRLMILKSCSGTGKTRQVLALSEALVEAGYSVAYFTSDKCPSTFESYSSSEYKIGYKLSSLYGAQYKWLSDISSLFQLKWRKYDLVIIDEASMEVCRHPFVSDFQVKARREKTPVMLAVMFEPDMRLEAESLKDVYSVHYPEFEHIHSIRAREAGITPLKRSA